MTMKAECIRPSSSKDFAQRIGEFVDKIDYRRMETPDQLEEVYRLRYEAYRREEFIDENAEKLCFDPFDLTSNLTVFGLYLKDKLISSIRIHVLDNIRRESPSSLVYSDKLEPLLDQHTILIDPTRFTTDYDASRKYKALHYATLRIAAMASVYHNADQCLSLIRPEHAAFYKKVYDSKQIGEERFFPKVKFPTVLYTADVKNIRENVWQRYPFFKAKRDENEMLFGTKSKTANAREHYLESVAEP